MSIRDLFKELLSDKRKHRCAACGSQGAIMQITPKEWICEECAQYYNNVSNLSDLENRKAQIYHHRFDIFCFMASPSCNQKSNCG